MRASLCIFLIALLISQNLCASTNTKSQDIQFLESIRRTEFGKTLLQSLQLTAKTHSKDAVQSILVILNQMLEDENDAQEAADAEWDEESGECDAQNTQLQSDIDDAAAQIVQNNNDIDLLNSAIAGSQASLDDANDKLVTSTNALQNLVDAREAEHGTFLQNMADMSATITALQQGKELLKQLEAEDDEDTDEFIQKSGKGNVLSQFTSHVASMNLKKTTKFHGFVTALLTMLSKQDIVADQALVDQILHLIENLLEQLSAELTTLASAESQAQLIFETQQTYLSSDIADLNSQIAGLQADITEKGADVADLTNDNSNLDTQIANKSQELADSQQTCADDEDAYDSTSEQRGGEIDIIQQVVNIFQTRFDNVQNYLTETSF